MNCLLLQFFIYYFWIEVDCRELKLWKAKPLIRRDYYFNVFFPQLPPTLCPLL